MLRRNPIQRFVVAAAFLALLARSRANGGEVGQLARTYTYHYVGEVMPTPQRAVYGDTFLPILDTSSRRLLGQITVRANASLPERIGAQEVANRVQFLAGGNAAIEGTTGPAGDRPWLVVGELNGPPALETRPRTEAYAIRPSSSRVEVVANDSLGLYWACQSLIQLLTIKDGKVVLRRAEIDDYPVFQVRSFKIGGQDWSRIESMGHWSPSAKFNTFNVCYTTVGRDQWPDPSPDYRAFVRRLCACQLPRGTDVMLFVNPYYLWKEHIQTSDPTDLDALARTCSLALEQGARKVMLCLDDFASKRDKRDERRLYVVMNEQDRKQFGDDLAKVNVVLLNGWYERMKAQFPKSTLLAVLPYYWLPTGFYREEGERNLREIGENTPKDLVIVWTGPRVRSTIVGKASVGKYTELLGRRPFLWDNTLYAWHNPPHYFLDEFKTQYPERFWEMTELGCHYNAGGGEAYKAGLWCVADWLWNPEAYDREAALRKAVAIVAGPDCVDLLLDFRDAFYDVRDGRLAGLGPSAAFLREARKAKASPLDAEDIRELRSQIARLPELAALIEKQCQNAGLVEEVKSRVGIGNNYLQAFELLAKLLPPAEGERRNLVANPSAEEVVGGRPRGFGTYGGAGGLKVSAATDAHAGKRSACFRATQWYAYPDGRKWINVGIMLGGSSGYDARNAIEVQPFCKYYFSFWAKSDLTTCSLAATGWREKKLDSAGRVFLRTRPSNIALSPEWQRYTGSFITAPNVTRAALKLGIVGNEKDGAKLGSLWVDDVYIGRGRP